MHKVRIFWNRRLTSSQIDRIRRRFTIKEGMTINGFTDTEIRDEDMNVLDECASEKYKLLKYITLS